MDLVMPLGIGGKEATREILGIDHAARVIASSGFSVDPVMIDYANYGFVGAINKPFNLYMLEDSLEAFGTLSC